MRFAPLAIALAFGLATASAQPVIDGDLTDAQYIKLDDNAEGPAPGFGTTNYLNAIYAHVDVPSSTLYLGVAGLVENNNRIVVFLDTRAGGYNDGDYGVGGPGGVANFNQNNQFDDGFLADFAIAIGTNAAMDDYFVDVVELVGDRATGVSNNRFLGAANSSANVAATPVGDAATLTTGFEFAIPFSALVADNTTPLVIDAPAISTFSVLTGDSGFLSNLTLTPASSTQSSNYGADPVDFGAPRDLDDVPASNPAGYAWLRTSGRAGWRQIGSPALNHRVRDFALQNHVQGITPSMPGTGSIENGVDNFVPYGGNFGPAYGEYSSDSALLGATRGHFWYLYDTMVSDRWAPLPFTMQAGSYELVRQFEETEYMPDPSETESYLLSNPFFSPFDTAELSEASGYTLSNSLFVWDPDAGVSGMYQEIDRAAADVASRTIPPMTGFWADLTSPVNSPPFLPSFRFDPAGRVRPAAGPAPKTTDRRGLAFELDLVDGEDTYLVDGTTRLVFADGAVDGPDAFDAIEPPAIASQYARLSIVDGDASRAVLGRELDPEAVVTTRLSVQTVALAEQTYRLRWEDTLPAGWTASLRDLATGAVVDLRGETGYEFVAADGPAEDRFELSVTSSSVVSGEAASETTAEVLPPSPNPTRGAATLRVRVDRPQAVRVEAYDLLGRRVATVFDGAIDAGLAVPVDASAFAPGVYVLRTTGETFTDSHRFTVSR